MKKAFYLLALIVVAASCKKDDSSCWKCTENLVVTGIAQANQGEKQTSENIVELCQKSEIEIAEHEKANTWTVYNNETRDVQITTCTKMN